MTTVDIPVGTPVFVRWYGKIVQGEVIDRKGHCDWPPFAEWIPIRMTIPNSEGDPIVPGVRNICMYHMNHVYASAEEAQQAEADFQQKPVATVPAAPPSADVPTVSDHSRPLPTVSDSSTKTNPSEAWQTIQKFKEEHWDQERNHLRIDALNDFYRLWRIAVAARYGVTIEEAPVTVVAVDPGSPDGDKSATIIVDTETGEILPELPAEVEHRPIVSEERYQELKEKMKVKLTKKQKNSTGRIEYTDSIQTSFFD